MKCRNSCLPQLVLEQIGMVRRAYQNLRSPVTVEDLADVTGLTSDQVVDCLAAMRLARPMPLEKLSKSGTGEPTSDGSQPFHRAEQAELRQLLAKAIASLPERQRIVVTLYYLEDLRLKEIGEVVGLSESRISRLLDAGLFALGEYMRANGA